MSKWIESLKRLPKIGDSVIAKTFSGQIFYAVYSGEDEFDTHRPEGSTDYREHWYKHSSRTIIKWKPLI